MTTWAEDRERIEKLKAEGDVTVGGVRFTKADYLDEAFEHGRYRENADAQFYRDALRDIAKLFGYEDYRQNPHSVAEFVELLRLTFGRERMLVGLATQIRDLLWPGSPGRPGVGTQTDLDAIVDAVRVLVESVREYDNQFAEVRSTASRALSERASLDEKVRGLELEVVRLKAVLKDERERGYNAALSDVRRAVKKIREEWS